MNNFYLYRFEGKTISQLLPWDKDSSFWAVDYDIWTNMEANALTRRALKEPPLQRSYVEALRRCATWRSVADHPATAELNATDPLSLREQRSPCE